MSRPVAAAASSAAARIRLIAVAMRSDRTFATRQNCLVFVEDFLIHSFRSQVRVVDRLAHHPGTGEKRGESVVLECRDPGKLISETDDCLGLLSKQ
jgi:hypothetical protein